VIDGVADAIAAFNRAGLPVIVVTNQAGIGRGYYSMDDYRAVNDAMAKIFASGGAHVDGWYCCPHAPWTDCACRKPRPGMLEQAAREHGIDLTRSVLVGDKESDHLAARAYGCGAVLVRTGYGRDEEGRLLQQPAPPPFDACFDSLGAAAPFVVDLCRAR
jgi:histidinol-phosphate phosphatase family protein